MLFKYLIADVDDTVTVGGYLDPRVLAAVSCAARSGLEVIFNTGRPAGYGAALLAYVAGVSAVVVENGGAWVDGRGAADAKEAPVQELFPSGADLRARLVHLSEKVAARAGLRFIPTADNAFRVTDYTVIRNLPEGADQAALLSQLAAYVKEESNGEGGLLASSIHLHFMLDGKSRRSKANGVAALLQSRGIENPEGELARFAVAVGDSANDASLFAPKRFALSVGVRNIERYLLELGENRPRHITKAAEGLGFVEVIEGILDGKLLNPTDPSSAE